MKVVHLLAGLILFALVIVVGLAVRIVYETVMLIPRVVHAERRGCLIEGGSTWPEHVVHEDRAGIERHDGYVRAAIDPHRV